MPIPSHLTPADIDAFGAQIEAILQGMQPGAFDIHHGDVVFFRDEILGDRRTDLACAKYHDFQEASFPKIGWRILCLLRRSIQSPVTSVVGTSYTCEVHFGPEMPKAILTVCEKHQGLVRHGGRYTDKRTYESSRRPVAIPSDRSFRYRCVRSRPDFSATFAIDPPSSAR